jgi:putative PIN family toxin of toxin-antitoxin system
VTSLQLVEELNHVLGYGRIAERIRLSQSEMDVILAALLSQAEVVPGLLELPGVTRDPKDDVVCFRLTKTAVVACAVEGEADYIVSGDEDLLALKAYEGAEIVAPRRFLEILQEGPARRRPSPLG